MLAVVKYGMQSDQVELRDVPEPQIGPEDVLLEVRAAGVCGSDVEQWKHNITYEVRVPYIMGHEFAGVIAQVGEGAGDWREGDEVVSETSAYICGHCPHCRAGAYNLCPERRGFGAHADGAFTRFVCVPARVLHRKPPHVSWAAAALTEPACVAYNAVVVKSDPRPGEPAVVVGPGPIGLFCLQVLRAVGATPLVLVGTSADAGRLELGRKLGAQAAVNVEEQDPVQVVLDLTGGYGAPLVVDAAGNSPALQQSLAMVARDGQITKVGWALSRSGSRSIRWWARRCGCRGASVTPGGPGRRCWRCTLRAVWTPRRWSRTAWASGSGAPRTRPQSDARP